MPGKAKSKTRYLLVCVDVCLLVSARTHCDRSGLLLEWTAFLSLVGAYLVYFHFAAEMVLFKQAHSLGDLEDLPVLI